MATDCGRDTAANFKLTAHAEAARTQHSHQVREDVVGDFLVEGSDVAEAPQVELQALQLDALLIWHVVDQDRGKVGLAGLRADTRKLRALELNLVVATRLGIREGIEDGTIKRCWFWRRHAASEAGP